MYKVSAEYNVFRTDLIDQGVSSKAIFRKVDTRIFFLYRLFLCRSGRHYKNTLLLPEPDIITITFIFLQRNCDDVRFGLQQCIQVDLRVLRIVWMQQFGHCKNEHTMNMMFKPQHKINSRVG